MTSRSMVQILPPYYVFNSVSRCFSKSASSKRSKIIREAEYDLY